jgi:hypothetical protein
MREVSQPTGRLLWKFRNSFVKPGQADVVPVAEALNDLLQGDAITKEQSAATLQRCLKILWTRLPSYTISRQDLARINRTYEGSGP